MPVLWTSTCLGALALVIALSAASPAETLEQLSEKANPERSLVICAGGAVTNYEPLAREFEQKFPGITVTVKGGFSNQLNQEIEQQFRAGRLDVDMALFQTAQDFVRWKAE